MEEAWQFVITRSEAKLLQDALRDEYEAAYRKQSNPYSVLAAIHVEPGAVVFVTENHRRPRSGRPSSTTEARGASRSLAGAPE